MLHNVLQSAFGKIRFYKLDLLPKIQIQILLLPRIDGGIYVSSFLLSIQKEKYSTCSHPGVFNSQQCMNQSVGS